MQVGSDTNAEAGIGFIGSTGSSYIVYRSTVSDVLTNVNNIAALSVGSTQVTSFVPFQSNASIYATEGYASGSQAAGLPAQFPAGAVGGHQNDPLTTPRGIVGVNQTTALSTPQGITSGSDINVTGNIRTTGYIASSLHIAPAGIFSVFYSQSIVIQNGSSSFYQLVRPGIYEIYAQCSSNTDRDCYAKLVWRPNNGNNIVKKINEMQGTNSSIWFDQGYNNFTLNESGQASGDTFFVTVYPPLLL
jgi:hypothetical protein